MKLFGKTVVTGLALVGMIALGLYFFTIFGTCEREVLSRAMSPNGNYSAEQVREICKGRIDMGLFVGPARPGVGASHTGQVVFRSQDDHDKEYALSIKPFRIWWESEKMIHVEYSKYESFSLEKRVGNFELEIKRIE